MAVELHIISDSTGETAARIAEATERQFPHQEFRLIRHPRVASVEDIHVALSRARGQPAVILYTLVQTPLRRVMNALCKRYRLPYCDLLRQPMQAVARVSGAAAQMQPGRMRSIDSTYFQRISAIEFAVRFDDGRQAEGLREADLVLVGVSRTSKTPLSIYLGYLGYKAANVPIVGGIEPPKALFEIDPRKIVGLTIDAQRLAEIRSQRMRLMGNERGAYARLVEIYDELEQARTIHRQLGCSVIDVTSLAIEETANRVLQAFEWQNFQQTNAKR